uniref:Uncharacterized protein n=1 Tax=Oryza nivara TaxID=4536 RepID=A0A0E0H1R6_ORYNI
MVCLIFLGAPIRKELCVELGRAPAVAGTKLGGGTACALRLFERRTADRGMETWSHGEIGAAIKKRYTDRVVLVYGVELPTCHSAIKCWYEMEIVTLVSCLGLALRAILILMISDAMLD